MLFQALEQLARFFLAIANTTGPEERFVASNRPFDTAAGADDGAVVTLAEALADFGEAEFGGFANQIHRDASGEADGSLAAAGHEVLEFHAEVIANGLQ